MIRKQFLIRAGAIAIFNIIILVVCNFVTSIAIDILMSRELFEIDQFMQSAILLTLAAIAFSNVLLIKTGVYKEIKND